MPILKKAVKNDTPIKSQGGCGQSDNQKNSYMNIQKNLNQKETNRAAGGKTRIMV